ncbi:packaged DNA stabilization protein [Pseudomonas sp. MONT-RG-20F-20-E-7-02]|uniref:packaged DNA stabilization protein n=1 Tax=Pseudomonas sp. MONT-RG-20F-20-E-7-02 TaxID=2914979 RepID=UPI001F5AD495|nr:packaged DNA stabilization protein [Pseudomonas sp. MONT-RG-20F-20-E-7-02]
MKVPLTTGAYQSRSVIAAAQRCANLYAERNPEGEEFPVTFYPTPGMRLLSQSAHNRWRGLYVTTTNLLFGVVEQSFVRINDDFSLTEVGKIDSNAGQVYMLDNGNTLVLVDGTSAGYMLDLASMETSRITDPAFYGSNRIDLIDGYMIFNRPGTKQFYISLLNQVAFDPLDFASKSGSPDLLVAAIATRRNLFLFGEQTTEIWTNTGGTDFTFSRLSGAFLQFGCASAASLAQADGSIYWLSRSPQGECMVLRTMNYDRERISTFSIENEIQGYARIDDAIAYIHQMSGHIWYVLTFPSANKTWVYDVATSEWHERFYLNEDGTESRHRGNCFAFWKGVHVVGDYQNGNLYALDLDVYNDNGNEVRRIRSFPHLADDGTRIVYKEFKAAMEVGDATYTQAAELRLRWSDTKGASWGSSISTTLGERGDYLKDCRFLRLGMARSRVFELSWNADCPTALNGAYIQVQKAAT